MQHQHDCAICAQIEQCENGTHPRLIAETETGWAVMGESQFFRGYSLLLCKTPATELDELPPEVRSKYLQEMALLAQAVRRVVQPEKLNYEALGNQTPHLHWHILPRHADDLQPAQPVWNFWNQQDAAHFFDATCDAALLKKLRAELQNLLPVL